MAQVQIRDANDNIVTVELPLAAGRAGAVSSRPVALSAEDYIALAPPRLSTSADLAFTAASAASAAINSTMVRLVAKDANCRIVIDATPVALATSTLLIAEKEYLFSMTLGHKVAAIRDASVDGVLNITTLVTQI